jgi:hypothetical protein
VHAGEGRTERRGGLVVVETGDRLVAGEDQAGGAQALISPIALKSVAASTAVEGRPAARSRLAASSPLSSRLSAVSMSRSGSGSMPWLRSASR